VALLAFAAGRRRLPLSVDISYQHGAQQQTRRSGMRRLNDAIDGRSTVS